MFPQVSALGPRLFNIYLNDLFYLSECTEVCNFADDATFYACDKDPRSLINRMEHDSLLAIEWFKNNHMKLNQENVISWFLDINTKIFGQGSDKQKSGKVGNKNY